MERDMFKQSMGKGIPHTELTALTAQFLLIELLVLCLTIASDI